MSTQENIIEIDEDLCDGCGDCIKGCHEGALAIVNGKAKLVSEELCDGLGACLGECPRGAIRILRRTPVQWPLQIRLVQPGAPYLERREWLVAADCVPPVMPEFQTKLRQGRALLIGCPKFDDPAPAVQRFTELFRAHHPDKVIVAVMPVPCCSGLPRIVQAGAAAAGAEIAIERVVGGLEGEIIDRQLIAPAPVR